jgi:cytoskeleton protein RodZ
MAFGASLKRERELRGISLEEISKATKISVRLLNAIETDRYDILPEGIFRKSFIKNYAKYLGMDEDQILQEYTVATQTESPPSAQEKLSGNKSQFKLLGRYFRWVIQGIIAVLLAGALYWYFSGPVERGREESVNGPIKPAPTPAQKSPAAGSSPAGGSSSSNAAASKGAGPIDSTVPPSPGSSGGPLKVLGERVKQPEPATAAPQNSAQDRSENTGVGSSSPSELTLGINATEECWLSVSAGDAPLYAGLLEPEQEKRFPIQKPLKLTFGNAGGVKLSVNGKPLTSVGKQGEIRVLEINPENYQHYLATPQ